MIYSMTAFGQGQTKGDWGMAIWELRSINHRYLEISMRLPEVLRDLEQNVREMIHQHFQRGKIECNLRFYPGSKLGSLVSINHALLDQLIEVANKVSEQLPEKITRVNLIDLLSWNGVVIEEGFDVNLIRNELLNLFKDALKDLKEGRRREGQVLAGMIKERLQSIEEQVYEVKQLLPILLERQREKIILRLEEARVSLDPQRLEQEMVYFSQKIDVAEEIDRMQSHITEVERTLAKGEATGRRLDFMMQELNREANTLASKSTDILVIHAAVEMKVLIEQIREQVQNIE